MRAVFLKRANGPERLVCEAELIFDSATEGPLAGLKLVGFSLWRAPDGETYVTLPARAFGGGSSRRFFDYVRPFDPTDTGSVENLKAWIIAEYAKEEAR